MDEVSAIQIGVVVPKTHVKIIKNALEAIGKLNKRSKIRPISLKEENSHYQWRTEKDWSTKFLVPTTFLIEPHKLNGYSRLYLVKLTASEDYAAFVSFVGYTLLDITGQSSDRKPGSLVPCNANVLARAVDGWLLSILGGKRETLATEDSVVREALTSCNWTYMLYPPLLLLPQSSFLGLRTIQAHPKLAAHLIELYALLCKAFKLTHIALNAPIPANAGCQSAINKPELFGQVVESNESLSSNTLRSPTNLTPLYGNFGPALPTNHVSNASDFGAAFWCTSQQNSIFQTWAPRYTMFSRGNISEKARILKFDSLAERGLGGKREPMSAVDLYAGIGYFAFSYAAGGVSKVLCWEINPWSIEGLRRGATKNKWTTRIVNCGATLEDQIVGDERLIILPERNGYAVTRVKAIRDKIPPVKHVNCGLLPSSKDSWEVAVGVLDSSGGWIHVHENIAKKDIETRREEIVEVFSVLVEARYGQEFSEQRKIICEHLELIKSYAPGVMHCVLDIRVSPLLCD